MPYELADDLVLAEEAVRVAASAAAAERAAGEVAYKASAGDPVVSADRAAELAAQQQPQMHEAALGGLELLGLLAA